MNTISPNPVVTLLGGGVESTALVTNFLAKGRHVVPVHVHCGLIWDDVELLFTQRFCEARRSPPLAELIQFRVPLGDWLGSHWAVTGQGIPRAGDDNHKLELPLRNLLLLSLALPKVTDLPQIQFAIGTTAENDFRDGTRDYFNRAAELLSLEAGRPVEILTPYIEMTKTDVIRASDRETLSLSFSCVDPAEERHCGRCVKCGNRRRAFAAAGVEDPTDYAHS